MSISLLVAVVIKGLKIWAPENSPGLVCDGYVKYEEAEADRLAIMLNYRNNEKKTLQNGRLYFGYFLF